LKWLCMMLLVSPPLSLRFVDLRGSDLHPLARNLQASSSNAFAFCPLYRYAVVPSSFRIQVSRCS
jgi:hypothetical protein